MTTTLDLLDTASLIDQDALAMQHSVRSFLDKRVRPHVAEWFETGQPPTRELTRELGELGVLGMHLTGYGCAGTSATAYGLACMELEAADSGIRSLVSVQGSLAMYALHAYGSEEQREEWLPRMARGEALGCFGLTEPDFGSDPGGMRTRAVRNGSDWVLNGSKMWISNGTAADVAIVWAQAGEEHGGIRGFVVPTDTPGFSAPEMKHKLSLRASVTAELVFDDVRLPESAMLPGARGLSGPLGCLNEARFGIVFGAAGAARDCLEQTLAYCDSRLIFGKKLAGFQATQQKLADMVVAGQQAVLLALHLGRLKDAGSVEPYQVSVGKLNNTRTALAIARECRTLLGANGITLEYSVMRHASNLESVLTYEGTAEIHQLVIGQRLTGVPAYR
jgi:glutaryl-CoA dehydrogenase